MRQVLYEDENIKCIYVPRNIESNTLVITFSDAINLVDSNNKYYADSIFIENDINSIGVVAKSPNWYPLESITSFYIKNTELINSFPKKIGYGSSMGAYGVIKYSKLLNFQFSIAMAPQWSISRDECNYQPGFQEFYKSSMINMGICDHEISGRIFLFYDPHSTIDTNHAHKIQEIYHLVDLIKVPYSGHTPARSVKGSSNLIRLINLAENRDLTKINKLVSLLKINNPSRNYNLFKRLINSKPILSANIILNRMNKDPIFSDIYKINYKVIIRSLSINPKNNLLLKRWVERNVDMDINLRQKVISDLLLGKGKLKYIQTHTKKFLTFDLVEERVSQAYLGESEFHIPILAYVSNNNIKLFIQHNESPIYLTTNEKNRSLDFSFNSGEDINFEINYIDEEFFAISHKKRFLSVGEKDIKFGPDKWHRWEKFRFEEQQNLKLWSQLK